MSDDAQEVRESLPSPEGDRLLRFFTYDHLSGPMQAISKPFCDLAHEICQNLARGPERTVALRHLLEAKDCAVRAFIETGPTNRMISKISDPPPPAG